MKISTSVTLSILVSMLFFLSTLFGGNYLQAEETKTTSLLEYYNTMDKETLREDTSQKSKKLKTMFNSKEIEATETELDFSRYFSNFKNLIRYVNKLAGYTDYEENIKFGRDREIYKLLPEEGELAGDRKLFVDEKYNRLEDITEEEILSYQDSIESSLSACEIYTDTTFWGDKLFQQSQFKEKMEDYFRGDIYNTYVREKRPILQKSHFEYVKRIDILVSSWKAPPPKPGDPIIDPDIVEKL